MLILQYKVIDMVVAFVLFIFMLVHCRVYCTATVFGEQRFIYYRPFRRRTRRVWWRGTVVERRSLAGDLSLSCARPAADG